MIFYVVGNGFDLHYRLNTSYINFKQYLIDHGYSNLIHRIDQVFLDHMFSPDEVECWSTLEDMLTSFCSLDAEEILDEALSNAEQDDDRADYFDSPAWNVDYYSDYIKVLKELFGEWISQIDVQIQTDVSFVPHKGDFILSFNYTQTIERNYDCDGIEIMHIHGKAGEDVILGHNDYHEPDVFPILWDEDSDYRSIKAQEAVNTVLLDSAELYFKNSQEIIKQYSHVFARIPQFDKVVIMGLSCGEQDEIYIREICKYATNVDFFWHSKTDIENFKSCICSEKVNVKYYHW